MEKIMSARNLLRIALETESMSLYNIETHGGSQERREIMTNIVDSLKSANTRLDSAIESMNDLI